MYDLLDDLNEQQRRAVTHGHGPMLVLAGPGSGKTRVLTRRIAFLVRSRGCQPGRILGITFTNRAAEEMKSRAAELLGTEASLQLGTFHWMCNAILRRHIQVLGRRRDFRVLAQSESRQIVRQVLPSGSPSTKYRTSAYADALSAWKNGIPMKNAAHNYGLPGEELRDVADRYTCRLKNCNALDLDDLLCLTLELLDTDPSVRSRCQRAHDEILVDEYQDVNPVQHRIVRRLAPHSLNVVAVGDDDQAIYGWRQADVQNMLQFAGDFPGAQVVKLEESYRSTKHILRAAVKLVEHNRQRLDKAVYTRNSAGQRPECVIAGDEAEEAEWIAREVERLRDREGRPWSDFAALFRVNAQSRALEDALFRRGVPYQIFAGHRFYERPEIRRLTAYLRLAVDAGDDEATAYLLTCLPGVGPRRLVRAQQIAGEGGIALSEAICRPAMLAAMPRGVHPLLEGLARQIEMVQSVRDLSLGTVVDAAIRAAGEAATEVDLVEAEAARENLADLRSLVQGFETGRAGLHAFVDRLALREHLHSRSGGMWLMSLHAAKGLEFPIVFLPGLEEGILPHRRALADESAVEEERRLCYVGMTRARERLYLSYAHVRMLGGQASAGHQSRFIAEMGRTNLVQRVAERAKARPRLGSVSTGERVMHSRWKAGTVLLVEGQGRDTMVTIQFDEAGRRRLQLCYAPLSRLEEKMDAIAG